MNYRHNSQNVLDSITKKIFPQRPKMLLETVREFPEVTLMMMIDTLDEDHTAINVDREVQYDQEDLAGREVQEDPEVLASQGINLSNDSQNVRNLKFTNHMCKWDFQKE